MSFIRMSPGLVVPALTTKFMQKGVSTSGTPSSTVEIGLRGLLCAHAQSTGEVGARIFIMKGTVPADFSTLTSYDARGADVLVTFDGTTFTGGGTNNFTPSQDNVNPVIISTIYRPATASGTATWFWWTTTVLGAFNIFSPTQAPLNQIFGTVGVTGSGADLEFPTVNVVAGEQYRIFNLRLQLPESWSW